MTLAQNIYESLMKDPDLDIGANQTREEFAKQEATQRAKQHYNNVEALSLANAPLKNVAKSPLFNLINYVNQSSATVLNIAKEDIAIKTPNKMSEPPARLIEDELIAVISDRDEEIQKLRSELLELEQEVLEIKQAAAQTVTVLLREEEKRKEANSLPQKAGESEELQENDEKILKSYPKTLSTAYATDLVAHQKKYKNYMAPKTQEALIDALVEAQSMGADIEAVIEEVKSTEANLLSSEKLEDQKNPEEFVSKSIITI